MFQMIVYDNIDRISKKIAVLKETLMNDFIKSSQQDGDDIADDIVYP